MTASPGNIDRRVRVAYIDDQLLFREALVNVLEASGSIAIVRSAGHQRAELSFLQEVPLSGLLMALDMQINDPMETLRRVRHAMPDLPICALVAVDRLERAREAISAGCKGAVSTAASLGMLIAALETIAAGEAYVDPTLGGRLLAKTIMRASAGRHNNKHVTEPSFVTKAGEISKN
jgi:DNA-binding NarL/FixJ family response regulator